MIDALCILHSCPAYRLINKANWQVRKDRKEKLYSMEKVIHDSTGCWASYANP